MGLRRGRLLWALALTAIAGCQAPEARSESSAAGRAQTEAEERDAIESRCGVEELRRYINAKLTEAVKAEIAQAVGQRRIRYIRPGDMVTMDYSAERLNVHIGPDERIVELRCG